MGAKFYTTCKAHANTKNYMLLMGNQKLKEFNGNT